MSIERILIADDELILRDFLAETLRRKSYDVVTAEDGKKALRLLEKETFDLVITDMKMPHATGIEVLKKAKAKNPQTLVVVATAFGTVENAVEAMRLGAFNYLIKPFSPEAIEALIEKAQQHAVLVEENSYLKQVGTQKTRGVIGNSPSMKRILRDVHKVAKSNASVFITGESGTGKEVIAQAIHQNSHRKTHPYVCVNCAAIPDTLVESEFFGHEKGSFTGANQRRIGRFQLADKGTLLLDEVTEIPIHLQPKLLRAIQEGEFERVGGRSVKVDVRFIATSNRNMDEAIKEQAFRKDLYYRLNVVPIYLPPLRERKEDIIPLAETFLEKMCLENHKSPKELTNPAKVALLDYNWPGNIRELANVIERVIVMDFDQKIEASHLYLEEPGSSSLQTLPSNVTLHALEKQLIIETLQNHSNNKTKAAKSLGITVTTLRSKMNKYGVELESS